MASSTNGTVARNFLDAAFKGDLQLLKRMVSELKSGDGIATAVANVKDENGRTALHFAAAGGKTHVCTYLIEELKLDFDIKDENGRTALHFAAAGGKTHVCKYLIEELKLDVDIKDEQHEVPLHYATLGGHLPTATYLLEKGANPTTGNDQRLTALHFAAEFGFKKLMCLLISKGAVVDAEADSGTPLHWASGHGKKEAVKILLENNANPNKISQHIFSPLVGSLLSKSFDSVKLLLKAGADPNTSSCGVTPLHIAASEGETEIIKCLLKAGANPNAVNNYDLTPVEVAAVHGNHEDVMILFPMTSRIPTIPDWSCGGIIKYVHSDKAITQRKLKQKEYFSNLKLKGEEAFKRKDYINAVYWYSMAIDSDLTDAIVRSNRSLCLARLKDGDRALLDAQACVSLKPDWPKAYYREGVAWNLLKQYHRARESFSHGLKLDPENEDIKSAFREATQAEQNMCLSQAR